jgi:PAS domain S-box-containing protein
LGLRKNGEVYPLRIEARNIPYKGKIVRVTEFRDITEQKHAEQALVESEKLYRQLVGAIHETLSVITKDGDFLFANEKASINLSGDKSPQNVIGKNIRDFISGEMAEEQIRKYQFVIKNQQVLQEEVFITFLTGNKWFINTLQPIHFGHEQIPAVMSTSLDITDRKTAELELKEKEHFINSIAENSPNIIYVFDIELNRNVYTNRSLSAMLGYSQDEVSDDAPDFFEKLIYPEDLKQFDEFYKNIFDWQEQKVFDYEYRILSKTKGWRWYKGSEKEFQRVDGKVISMIGTVSDITAAKIAENAVTESEEKFRLLITQMEQGLALHEAIYNDQEKMVDYRFLDVNESFERITGLKRHEILGKKVLEVLPQTEKYWIENYGRVVETGKPLHYENFSKDLGKYYEVVAYRNREHQFAVIISDITQRKRSEIIQQIQYKIARNVLESNSLEQLAETVRIELSQILDTTNFLVGLYDEQEKYFKRVVYRDEQDDFAGWKAENSLSGQVVKRAKTML